MLKDHIVKRFIDEQGDLDLNVSLTALARIDEHTKDNYKAYKSVQIALNGEPSEKNLYTRYSARIYCRYLYLNATAKYNRRLS